MSCGPFWMNPAVPPSGQLHGGYAPDPQMQGPTGHAGRFAQTPVSPMIPTYLPATLLSPPTGSKTNALAVTPPSTTAAGPIGPCRLHGPPSHMSVTLIGLMHR